MAGTVDGTVVSALRDLHAGAGGGEVTTVVAKSKGPARAGPLPGGPEGPPLRRWVICEAYQSTWKLTFTKRAGMIWFGVSQRGPNVWLYTVTGFAFREL